MEVIDKILNEWSFRCHDGIVDMNDPKKVKILFEIIRPVLAEDIDDDILNALISADSDTKSQVLKFIKKSISKTSEKSNESGFYSYLKKHNITPESVGNLSELVFEILSNNDDLDKFNEYKKSPLPSSDLGQSGNIFSILSNTGVSQESISQILNLVGTEEGRGIGKGEILIALFFADAKISEGKGDLTSSEGSIEIKAYGARLGTRGTDPSVFSNSNLAKLAIDYEIDTTAKGIRIDTLIADLATEADNKIIYKATIDFLKNIFPNIDVTQFLDIDMIKNASSIRKALNKMYILNYFTKENIDKILYINTKTNPGNYIFFTLNEIPEIVNNNLLKINPFSHTDMNPQIK